MSSNFIELNKEDINKKYVDSVRKATLDSGFNTMMQSLFNMSSLTEDNKELLKNKQKELRELYNQYYDNPKFLADKIADIVDPANAKLRKAIQDAADTTMEADEAAVKFTKSMVGFGNIVNKLASQNYSVSDILQNKLKLPEVDFFKRQIQRNIGVRDFNILQPYLEQFAINMKSGMSNADIKTELANDLQRHGILPHDMDATAIVETIFDPIQNMFKLYDEFNKKFKELDFIKFINELDYGTEISGFEKYKRVGSKLIASLKNTMINVNGGEQAFGTLFDKFRASLENGLSFKDAKQAFIDNYGSDAFELFYDKFKDYQGLVKEFVTKVSESDFTKLLNKMQFGSEMTAFKQYMQIDSKKIAYIMQRELIDGTGLIFEDAFNELVRNTKTLGVAGAREKFKNDYGEDALIQLDNLTKEFDTVWSGSSYSLMQSNKNLKKKIHTFLKNFADAFLTPIQQFDKTEAILKKQLAKVKQQAKEGVVNPELVERTLENIEKLQKLNEETMQMKVPSAITASEAVRTGSKEAFDLVATNIFRDMYKVNKMQLKKQEELVGIAKIMQSLMSSSDDSIKSKVGVYGKT